MLLATLLVLALVAAIFAVTQIGALITVLFVIAVLVLAYKRLPLLAFSVVFTLLFAAYSWFGEPSGLWKGLLLLMLVMMWLFNIHPLRKALISRPFLKTYLRLLPTMSPTEREALEAGTVWWDGELFTGKPDWNKLLQTRPAQLTAEEQAFLDGPCEELCAMVDDFDVTHRRADLSPQAWEFIKSRGFLAMIIPKQYGGLEFGQVRAVVGADQAGQPQHRAVHDGGGAELARTRRTAGPLRHRGAEEPLPAAPGARRGDPLLRADQPDGRLRCGVHQRHRHRVPRECTRAAKCWASGSTSPSATSRWRRWPRSSDWPSACSIRIGCSVAKWTSASPARCCRATRPASPSGGATFR